MVAGFTWQVRVHLKHRRRCSGSLSPASGMSFQGDITAGERAGGEGATRQIASAPSPRPSSPTAKSSPKAMSPVGEREQNLDLTDV